MHILMDEMESHFFVGQIVTLKNLDFQPIILYFVPRVYHSSILISKSIYFWNHICINILQYSFLFSCVLKKLLDKLKTKQLFPNRKRAQAPSLRKVMDKPLLYTSDHSRIHGLGVSSASSFSEYIKIMIRSILSVMQIYFDFKYT